MAGKSTISITFKLDGDGKGFKELSAGADGLKKVISSAVSEAQALNSEAINFAAIASSLEAMQRSFQGLLNGMQDLADAYAVQEVAETKLAVIMQQRMNATQAEIQSIKDLTSAQQELGVIGDEVQLSGAQQIATFLTEAASLEVLIPAMNNLLAQQKGLNATTQDAVSIANLMGKVMQGQVSSLREVGITFSEAEEEVLKYGTESERAAMLSQVITNNVGEMNAALAQTDSGKQQQLVNTLGDIKEQLGGMVNAALPFVTIAAHSLTALTNITTLTMGVKKASAAIAAFNIKGKAMAALVRLMGVDVTRTATVMRVFTAATQSGAYAATAFKLALRGLMIATGVGLAIAGVTAAIEKFISASDSSAESIDSAAVEMRNFMHDIRDISKLAAAEAQKEIATLDRLYSVAKDELRSREDRSAAIKELQSVYPDFFGNLDAEAIKIQDLTKGYEDLREEILKTARVKGAEQKLIENAATMIELEEQIKKKNAEIHNASVRYYNQSELDLARRSGGPGAVEATKERQNKRASSATMEIKVIPVRNGDGGIELVSKADTARLREVLSEKMLQSLKVDAPSSVQPLLSDLRPDITEWEQLNKLERQLPSGSPAGIELGAIKISLKEKEKLESQLAAINEANEYLYDIIGKAGSGSKGGGSNTDTPKWKEDAATLKEIGDNLQILNDKLQTATIEEAALINQQIEAWTTKAEAIRNAGKVTADNTPLWKEDAATLQDIAVNIQILSEQLQTATIEEAALINQQIAAWNAKADAIKNAGKAAETITATLVEEAATLKDINSNIRVLESQLESATIEEAALINQQIEAWNAKADAIRNAGKEAEKASITTGEGLKKSWGAIKNVGNSVENITEALKGNGSAWQAVVSIIDGFIGIYEGIQTIVGIIQLLTAASAAHATTKVVEAGAETGAASSRAAAATTNALSGAAEIATNKAVAASFKELAASEYMAAHAAIPFAGFGIGAGFTSAMLAMTTAAGIPALADGGIASGPTLALVGEYAGASGNPEVIAPLDELRSMLQPSSGLDLRKVQFEIKGRTLVGILAKENNVNKRS